MRCLRNSPWEEPFSHAAQAPHLSPTPLFSQKLHFLFCFVVMWPLFFFTAFRGQVKSNRSQKFRGGGVLPYKRLMEMCRWMGSHLHDWIDYNGVSFSMELLAWGCTFSDFWGKTVLHIYGLQMYQNVYISGEK